MSLYLGISRQRGQNPAQNLPTLSGSEVRLNPDGTRTITDPQVTRTSQAGTTSINVKARTPEEMRNIVNQILQKTPQLAGTDPEDLLETASETATFSSDPMLILTQLECPTAAKSVVKSAIALACDAGIDPQESDLALQSLLDPNSEPSWGLCFHKDFDFISIRPNRTIFHCVAVKGSKADNTLLAYIELFSIHRIVVCLSKSYTGEDVTHSYAIDPVSGRELNLSVEIELSGSRVEDILNNHIYDVNYFRIAADEPLRIARRRNFELVLPREIEYGVRSAYHKYNKSLDEQLSRSEILLIMSEFNAYIRKLLEHNRDIFENDR